MTAEPRKASRGWSTTARGLTRAFVGLLCGLSEKDGAAEGTRTPDPIITNDVLYQLSYSGILLGTGPTMALPTIQPPA